MKKLLLNDENDDDDTNQNDIEIIDFNKQRSSNKVSYSFYQRIKSGFNDYSSNVNWKVFTAISLFTLGSWLDLSGK